MQPRYWEALVIGWRILWQGVGSTMAALFTLNLLLLTLLPELPRTTPSLWAAALPLLIVFIVALFIFMPLVVRALLSKPFRGFRLRLVRDTSDSLKIHPSTVRETDDGHTNTSAHAARLDEEEIHSVPTGDTIVDGSIQHSTKENYHG